MVKRETERDKMLKQIMSTCRHISAIWPEIDTLFSPFFEEIKIKFLIQNLISQPIVSQNQISTYQYLSLGIGNTKQIKF